MGCRAGSGRTWREEVVRPVLVGRGILQEIENRDCGSHCYQCNQ